MARALVLLTLLLSCVCWTTSASGQYIFADTNGDGISTSADRLQKDGRTNIDIWLQTDSGRDGTKAPQPKDSPPLSFSSYQFVLKAMGGTVDWGTYINLQPTMIYYLGRQENATELAVGYGGIEQIPPGKYKLGTVSVKVGSGSPTLAFLSRGSVYPYAITGFGSRYEGRNKDNTIRLAKDSGTMLTGDGETVGDWTDADGVGKAEEMPLAAKSNEATAPQFGIAVVSNPGRRGQLLFTVTTTKPGFLRLRLFDPQGRLVRILAAEDASEAGLHIINLGAAGAKLASGVYLYRLEAAEGTKAGRITILK